ncbi:MAG: MBL fold metallo-hydrolase [Pyrinomonadaceae bacterium]
MKFGDCRIEIIPDTEFRLDGGAMFGVVPKVLWERENPSDKLNRILMNMNCLFVETANDKILVETGIGEKWTPKEVETFGISRKKSFRESLLEIAGCAPEEITFVVNTHLHFDHAGGNTVLDKSGTVVPQFPNARYLVSESEFRHATSPHERDRASYRNENWQPLIKAGILELMPDFYELSGVLTMQQVRGHNETMQTARLTQGDEILYGFSDLVPMVSHLKLPWIAGFDLFPVETLEAKRNLLNAAAEGNWFCLFYHEPKSALCKLELNQGRFSAIAAC